MIVQIAANEAVNPYWVVTVENSPTGVFVYVARPGGTAGIHRSRSDHDFATTLKMLNGGADAPTA